MTGKAKKFALRILLIVLACVCVAYFSYVLFFQPLTLATDDFGSPKVLNKWYVQIDGAPYGSVSIPGTFYSGRQVSLLITLPDIEESDYISVYTANTRIMIYADKELIYTFGFDGNEATSIPPILYQHLIQMEPEYTGMRLRIDLYPVYFPASRITRPVLLGSVLQIQLYNFSVIRSDTVGYVLAAIGGVILFFGIYYFSKNKEDRSLLVLSGLYLLLGGKLCTQSCLTASLVSDPYTSFYFFWLSLLSAPLFVMILLYRSYGRDMPRFFRRIIYGYVLFMLTALVLILLDIELYAVLLTIFNILITSFMVALFVRFRIKKLSRTTAPLVVLFGLFLVDISNHYFQYIPVAFLSYNSLWLTVTAFYFTYYIIASKVHAAYTRENEYQVMLLKSESLLQSYTQIDEYTTKIEKLRHDMNRHLTIIRSLIESEKQKKACEYIRSLLTEADAQSWREVCPNHIINAILNRKLFQAEQFNVDITCSIRLPRKLGIADVDICSVFANCLDNALKAARLAENKRRILVTSYIKNDHLYLCVENTAPDSSPPVRKGHGLGLKIVRDIADKYNGIMQITRADGLFKIEVALKQCTQLPEK